MMEYTMINGQIAFVLLLWILATFGYGIVGIKFLKSFIARLGHYQRVEAVDIKFYLLLRGIIGIFVLSLLIQLLHFFIPINSLVSIICAFVGIALFLGFLKQELCFIQKISSHYMPLILALLVGLSLAILLSIRVESAFDTGLYHIQAVKWIQEQPIIFGIANIHTRLGFNNLLYNFAALTEVSHIFPHIRSFLPTEILAFFFFASSFLSLYHLRAKQLNDIFMCIAFIIMLIELWWLGGGMYAEGVLGVLGLSLVGYMIYIIENHQNKNLFAFLLLFVIAFFSIYIKISAVCLLLCVLCVYFQSFGLNKISFKLVLWLCGFSTLLGLPWALKGICISGMVAYPASVFYLDFLPWAIDNTTRANEVMIIHNWAKVAGTPNRDLLLQDFSWIKVWFNLFFWQGSFKALLQLALSSLAFLALFLGMRWITFSSFKPYLAIWSTLIIGIIFWFISAPDPRFGFQYFFPLFALLGAFVLQFFLNHKTHYMLGLCFLCICSSISLKHIHINATDRKEVYKIPQVDITSQLTDSHLLLYLPQSGDRVYDAPLPATAYFNAKLSKGTFLGRDMYFIQKEEQ